MGIERRRTAFFIAPVLASVLCVLSAAGAERFEFSATSMTSVFAQGREQTILRGDAVIVSEDIEIRAQTIVLSGKDFRWAESTGGVRVIDRKRNLSLRSDTLSYDRQERIMRATGAAVLEDRENEVIARGERIEIREQEELVTLQTGVRVLKEGLSARSEFARYDRAANVLELSGLPVVHRERDVFRAARIIIDLDSEEIRMQGEVRGTIAGGD